MIKKAACDPILKCSLIRTDNRFGMGSLPFSCERRRQHKMPNGDDLATEQLPTAKLTWMLATIQMSGTSTYWALPERIKFSAKTRIRPG